jgi:hypothetical protein
MPNYRPTRKETLDEFFCAIAVIALALFLYLIL